MLERFRTSALWAQVQEAAQVHIQVEFAAPDRVRGVIDLIFWVAGGWKILDYQSEPPVVGTGSKWGEKVVERGVWLFETGVWRKP